MTTRLFALAALTTAVLMAPSGAAAQTLKTPWGDPDLQGTWDYRTITPLERAQNLGNREFYTEE